MKIKPACLLSTSYARLLNLDEGEPFSVKLARRVILTLSVNSKAGQDT